MKNYSQIPPWYRPTQAQLSVPHPSYIDYLVFPLLREKLVYTHDTYETPKLLEAVNSLFTIVWEPKIWLICQGLCDVREAHTVPTTNYHVATDTPLISLAADKSGEFHLEPNFEAAIWDLRSWRMTADFVTLYPELASCVHTD